VSESSDLRKYRAVNVISFPCFLILNNLLKMNLKFK
jgi:hypothetical protein